MRTTFLIYFFAIKIAFAFSQKPQHQFLGVLTLTDTYKKLTWTDQEMAVVSEHFKRLQAEHQTGKIIFAGRTQYENNHPDLMGLVVFYATDLEEAVKFMQEDAAVKANIMTSVVHPYDIAVGNSKI